MYNGAVNLATETAMPTIEWAPFFAFMISTTLSPGPNNMAVAAMLVYAALNIMEIFEFLEALG